MQEPNTGYRPEEEEDFATLWEQIQDDYSYRMPERGEVREGVILSVRPGEVLVDIGGKEDAQLASREIDRMSREEFRELEPGGKVMVYVMRIDSHTGGVIVSLRMAREQQDWVTAEELLESGDIVNVTVSDFNKGGLLARFKHLQAFIPASQVLNLNQRANATTQQDALQAFVGRDLVTKVIEVNRRRRRLIVSERAAMREWRTHQREQLLAEIEVDETRKGVVSNLVDFGAFVDLGGIDGLVHLSEISWGRIDHPRDVLKIGDEVDVYVLNVDQERQRIGLSIKRTLPDPWSLVDERYTSGQRITGKVTHLVSFGAFVELEPGVEGLIHVSELADGEIEPGAVVAPGEELELIILSVDAVKHRISLSLRQAQPDPEPPAEEDVDLEEDPYSELDKDPYADFVDTYDSDDDDN